MKIVVDPGADWLPENSQGGWQALPAATELAAQSGGAPFPPAERMRGLAKGNYLTNGNLVAFTEPISASEDIESPVPKTTQQPAGQKQIFWIDSPGFSYFYTPPQGEFAYGVDSVTDVTNLVSTVRSKSSAVCKPVSWNIQIRVGPGRNMNLNRGALGKAPVNF